MTTSVELESAVKNALNCLHSTNPNSAKEMRNSLDEIIKQRYGPSKMLINTLSKKHLDEEDKAPGNKAILDPEPVEVHSSPPISLSPSDDQNVVTLSDDVENLKEFGDLDCVVCGDMMFTATNRLFECADCHSLYHQECHKPHISEEDAKELELSWCCINCKNCNIIEKSSVGALATKSSASSSSHSSASSSPYSRPNADFSCKAGAKSNIGSKTHLATPSINIISATDKTSSNRKHHQSKSKSSHHDKKKKSSK